MASILHLSLQLYSVCGYGDLLVIGTYARSTGTYEDRGPNDN